MENTTPKVGLTAHEYMALACGYVIPGLGLRTMRDMIELVNRTIGPKSKDIYTHQYPRIAKIVRERLRDLFPVASVYGDFCANKLKEQDESANVRQLLAQFVGSVKGELVLHYTAEEVLFTFDQFDNIELGDPIQELMDMVGPEKVMIVSVGVSSDAEDN